MTDSAMPPPSGPAYLIHSAVQSPEGGRTNYYTVADSLAQREELDYDASLEVPGRSRLYAESGIGFFAVGDGEDVSITRYELREDGGFEPGPALSLQPFGVTSMGAQAVLFVSATKAYYKDDDQAQIIVWNPAEMIVEDTIELPAELLREGRVTGFSAWAQRGDEAYIAVRWSSEQYDRMDPGTTLVRLDTTTDEITVTTDDRCRGIAKTARHEDTLYFFSSVINGFGFAVYGDDGGQQDCILRILPGETTFDAEYVGSLAPALEDHEVGTGIAVTENGRAWFQVVDTTMVPTEPGATYSEWYSTGWTWRHVDLATLADPVVAVETPGAYSGSAFVAGSRFFISQTEPDYSSTTLVDLSGDTAAPGVSFPGFTLDVAQVR